jgi:hypothetical protein
MTTSFKDKFGQKFDPERQKIAKGMKFTLTRIVEITESLKKDKNGETYRIASFDGMKGDKPVKYYSSNSAIVNQIESQIMPDCDAEGNLSESVDVTVVQKTTGEGGFKYLAFE